MEDKILKVAEKYEDYWSKHNLTSRISIILFVLVYVISVIILYFYPVKNELASIILQTTGNIAMITILVIILGPNTIVKLAEIYTGNKKKIDDTISKIEDDSSSLRTPKTPKDI